MPTRYVLAGLVVLVLIGWAGVSGSTLGLTRAAVPAAPSGVCPPVQNTPFFTIVYGSVTLDGVNAPAGTAVEARSPREDTVGCFVVSQPGNYGAMYVYGEDTSVSPPIPGMRNGEVISFFVDSNLATATPQLAWSNDKELHEVGLAALSPPPAPDLIVQNMVAEPSTPAQNQPIVITVTIRNQGALTVTRRFDTDAYDDHSPTGCNDYGWDYRTTNSLGVGEIISLTFTHRGFATTGTHSFYAQVDSGCAVAEGNENNNIYGPLQVQVIPPTPPPTADFSALPTSGFAPLAVQFTDQSTGSITSWSWSFGDGGSDSSVNPIHTYNQPGIYTVTLTVTGPSGSNTLTRTNYIIAMGLAPTTSTRVSPGAITTHTLTLTNTDVVSHTFVFTAVGSLPGWKVLMPPPASLDAGLSSNVVATISIAVTATNWLTDTVALTVSAPSLVPSVATLVTGTGCRYDFTGDGYIRNQDIQRMAYYIGTSHPFYDLDHNGFVRNQDVQRAAYFIGTSCR